MLRLLIFRFWPVLLPLFFYWLWLAVEGRRATIEGKPAIRFRDGPWYWAALASLLLALACFLFWAREATQGDRGNYIPPHMENGRVVPGQVSPP